MKDFNGQVNFDQSEIFDPYNTIKNTAILVSKQGLKNYAKQLQLTKLPIVDLEYLRKCLEEERFYEPHLFDLLPDRTALKNKHSGKKTVINEQELIDNVLGKKDSSDIRYNFFKNCIISC